MGLGRGWFLEKVVVGKGRGGIKEKIEGIWIAVKCLIVERILGVRAVEELITVTIS